MAPRRLGPWVLLLLSFGFASSICQAQQATTQTATSDTKAVALATQALAALTGGLQINDVTLAGTAVRTAGSDVASGTITLKALGTASSRTDFVTSGKTRSEIRNAANGSPQGSWVGTDGVSHGSATHNCFTDAAWFFPALSILSRASNSSVVAKYVGEETRGSASVQHIRLFSQIPSASSRIAALLASLSTEDIYLDATSSLPVAILFNVHPDDNAQANIQVEIDFSNYQTVNGLSVPFRIQQLISGSLFLDVTVQSANLNSGISSSAF